MPAPTDDYQTCYGVQGQDIVTVRARRVQDGDGKEDGWMIRKGCLIFYVETEKLFLTREEAEARLKALDWVLAPNLPGVEVHPENLCDIDTMLESVTAPTTPTKGPLP